ncbi:hypothetical protein MIMGU_mgv1a022343mg [Erythranthe guttata]|uniref:Homeobox domain-containing protein n=1 Tax=Erythranthe guttata TaxID=4155 RepID=A0A022PTP3_ERYGU|nr:PREDICTED: WUSCHEL-related homeobox 3-like [Erythranthe guttata]EYU18899.1 hypothetical protein MIMGU_mgv1a022343mg [Erythranthe guttata]|eukprot:XP_012827770.1 PREDICTED: WUSCHEL-related homeobox 3-like [Erythranthe guttata]
MCPASSAVSRRWCPTAEQVMILDELYRRGLKTPNSAQIQRIAGHLSFYGKVQGKNVFYWFQNHKARERQKLRKKFANLLLHHQHHHDPHTRFLDPQTRFLQPPPFHQLLSHGCSDPPNLLIPQHAEGGTAINISEEAPHGGGGVVVTPSSWMSCSWRRWRDNNNNNNNNYNNDIPTYGHDSAMITGVGPTYYPCFFRDDKPLQTLQLFPLSSSPPRATTTTTTTASINE